MKKFAVSTLILAMSLALLTGCPGDQDDGTITLVVWESLGGSADFVVEAGRRFTELHPHITIQFVNVEIGGAASQMALDGPAGVGPDLFVAPHDALGELVVGGHIMPTSNPTMIRNRILASAATAVTFNGIMYGYPISAETYALFYNRDLISSAEVPRTFEDLITWSTAFNAANPGRHGFMFDVNTAYYTIIFTTAGGNRLFGPSGTDRHNSNINSPASVRGMEFFQRLRREILDVPAGDMDTAFADAAFSSGHAAMHLTGPWNIMPFVNAGVNFGVTTIPSLPGETSPPASFAGTRVMFVSAFSRNTEAAQMFGQFVTSPEMQQLRFDITGAIPSIPMHIDSPFFPGFLAQLEYAFPMPSIPEMTQFWGAMGAASINIWNGADVQSQLDMANTAMVGN